MSGVPSTSRGGLRGQEDWDVHGHTSSKVANVGPPTVKTKPKPTRARGRGIGIPRGVWHQGIFLPDVTASGAPQTADSSRPNRGRGRDLPPTVAPKGSRGGGSYRRGGARGGGVRGGFGPRGGNPRVGGRGGGFGGSDRRTSHDDYHEEPRRRNPLVADTWTPSSNSDMYDERTGDNRYFEQDHHAGPSRPRRAYSPSQPIAQQPVSTIPHPSYSNRRSDTATRYTEAAATTATTTTITPTTTTPNHTRFDDSDSAIEIIEENPKPKPKTIPKPVPPAQPAETLVQPSRSATPPNPPVINKLKFKPINKGKRRDPSPALNTAPVPPATTTQPSNNSSHARTSEPPPKLPTKTIHLSSSRDSKTSTAPPAAVLPKPMTSIEETTMNEARPATTAKRKAKQPAKVQTSVKEELPGEDVEEETPNSPVRDEDRTEGVLAFKRNEVPPACYGKVDSKKATARTAFKKVQSHMLKEKNRKLVTAIWRDDGVAFEWVAIQPKDAGPSGKSVSRSGESAIRDVAVSTASHAIPYPAELATEKARLKDPKGLADWRFERELEACKPDGMGRIYLKAQSESTSNGIIITTTPIDPDTVPCFPTLFAKHHEAYEKKVKHRFPSDLDPTDPDHDPEALVRWVNERCLEQCHPDSSGNATRFVGYYYSPSKLILIGRTDEDWDADEDEEPEADVGAEASSAKRRLSPASPGHTATKRTKTESGTSAASIHKSTTGTTSPLLEKLQETIAKHFEAIENWTDMLPQYPEKRDFLTANIERVQDDVFKVQKEIKEEKRRLGLL